MKKLKLRYGGGEDSILLNLAENKLYSFEKDFLELQEKFGAEMTYISGTGLTGMGIIPQGDFILFGYHRIDVGHPEQQIKTVYYKKIEDYYKSGPIFGYAPIISHGGIEKNSPFVLSDGAKVAFIGYWEVLETLKNWSNLEFKRMRTEIFRPDEDDHREIYEWGFYNSQHFKGLDARRFLDFRHYRELINHYLPGGRETIFERNLKIFSHTSGDETMWYGYNDYYPDALWDSDPRKIVGTIHNEWEGNSLGLYWKRVGFQICAFFECRREEIRDGIYVYENSYEFVDYEENFSLLDWYQKPVEEWSEYFLRKVTYKASKDALAQLSNTRQIEALVEKLGNISNVVLTLQDSFDAGNCRPGTDDFIRRFGLKPEMKISEIVVHPQFEEMLQNRDFRKVLILKLDTVEN